ncbi:MAG: MMPL family transporter, partial [Deltaproteobacteria bacterium]|nr:MMPL family transporter [Deltaproteobacteria bacterium]
AITSGLTVAATFLVLIVNDFKGFSEFGFITGTGIIIVYAAYHILFPPILIAAEKLKLLNFKQTSEQHVKDGIFKHSKAILGATAVLFCLSAVGLAFTQFEYNFGKLKANIEESKLAREKLRKTTASVNRPASVLIKNLDEAVAIKEFVRQKIEEDETAKRPAVLDVYKSWYDIVQYEQDEKMAVIGEIKKLLSDKTIKLVKGEHKKDLDKFKEILNETVPIKESEIPGKVKEIFFGTANADDGLQISYINAEPHLELDDGKNAIAFAERVEKMETDQGTFHASSDAIVFADVLRTMLKDVPRVVILSFGMVLLFVFLDFRSFKKTALVVSPIILGVVITFGFMFLFRMKLNFYNMIVIPTVFGTSIDNSIHIYHRYEEMGKGSLMKVIKTSGSAALMSSLTNIFGFLGLVFANHLGLASIGKLAIVGMSACLFTTLIYFPAMMERLQGKQHAQ